MNEDGSFDVDDLYETTSLTRRPGETTLEFVSRVAESHGLSSGEARELEELVTKAIYGREALTPGERQELDAYLSLLSDSATDTESDQTESTSSSSDELETEDELPDELETEDESPDEQATTYQRGVSSSSKRASLAGADPRTSSLSHRTPSHVSNVVENLGGFDTRDVVFSTTLFGLAAFVFFYKLGAHSLLNWDEGVYANLARNMVQHGYWLVPHMNYNLGGFEPWMMKPPLAFWFQALSMSVFGVNEFAVRFPSALFGVFTVGLVYLFGRDIRSRFAGFVAGVVYLTTPYVYMGFNATRTGAVESAHLFFGSLFVYCVWKAVSDGGKRWFRYAGVAGGMAVMVKSFAAGVFVIVVLPLVLRYWRVFVSRAALKGVGLGLAIVLPWTLFMLFRFGYSFVDVIFVQEVLLRASGERVPSQGGTFAFMDYPYFRSLWGEWNYYYPWVFVLIGALAGSVPRLVRERSRDWLFVVWWAAIVLAFFAYTGTQRWYIMPMYVPGALFVGLCASSAVDRDIGALFGILFGIVLALVYSSRFALTTQRGLLLVLVGLCLGFVVAVRPHVQDVLSRDEVKIGQVVVSVFLAVLVVSTFVGMPPFYQPGAEFWSQQEEMGEWVQERTAPDETVYVESGIGAMHSFSFYVERPITAVDLENIPDDATYAVVRTSSLSRVGDEYTVVYNITNDRGNRSVIRIA